MDLWAGLITPVAMQGGFLLAFVVFGCVLPAPCRFVAWGSSTTSANVRGQKGQVDME
jgi:hypothetical protein